MTILTQNVTKINRNRYDELMSEYQFKTLQHIGNKDERMRLLEEFNAQFDIVDYKDLPTKEEENEDKYIAIR